MLGGDTGLEDELFALGGAAGLLCTLGGAVSMGLPLLEGELFALGGISFGSALASLAVIDAAMNLSNGVMFSLVTSGFSDWGIREVIETVPADPARL